jgi:hypothetical protein
MTGFTRGPQDFTLSHLLTVEIVQIEQLRSDDDDKRRVRQPALRSRAVGIGADRGRRFRPGYARIDLLLVV